MLFVKGNIVKRYVQSISNSAGSPQISEPLLRLIRHSDPRDLADSPSLSMAVERFKRRFAQRLHNNLEIARSIIRDSMVAEGFSESLAQAETDRFARQVARLVADFQREVESGVIAAEATEQVQAGLDTVQPMLPGGEA